MTGATKSHHAWVVVDDMTDEPVAYSWTREEARFISMGLNAATRVVDSITFRQQQVAALGK